ncbi:hypothetical protein T01_10241 [Trichinella spiralis]|uniref:Uncharacterized protein n=1 Tax=Trichinella spiralis TaxID=6334 RepID=A0A0V1AM89_TRISP|nr:hypothetical protein T01_10241 [Trichinella spiralis]
MGDSPKNGSDALDPEKRFREGHLFDGTRYSKYEIITGYDQDIKGWEIGPGNVACRMQIGTPSTNDIWHPF